MNAGSSACSWTPSDAFTLTVHKTTSIQILLGDIGKDPHAVSRHKKAILFFFPPFSFVTTFGPSTTLSNFRFGSVMQPNSLLKVAKL